MRRGVGRRSVTDASETRLLSEASGKMFNIQQFYVLPHTAVFMCFVWISEQTAIISLYSINWLVFITQTECVYCAVRTGYLYIIQVSFSGL